MKKITLTFDNGPDPECTPWVLEELAKRQIKATFFVCGEGTNIPPHFAARGGSPESQAILKRVKAEGHWVGNHSLTHTVELGTTVDEETPKKHIGESQTLLGDVVADNKLFRPYMSGGLLGPRCFSPASVKYLCDNDYTVVLFNCVPRDWEIPETWPEEAFKQGENIEWMNIIVHDLAMSGAMKQLPRFLDECIEKDIEFVQDFPPDTMPIIRGVAVSELLEGLVCGDIPEISLVHHTNTNLH